MLTLDWNCHAARAILATTESLSPFAISRAPSSGPAACAANKSARPSQKKPPSGRAIRIKLESRVAGQITQRLRRPQSLGRHVWPAQQHGQRVGRRMGAAAGDGQDGSHHYGEKCVPQTLMSACTL